MTPNGFPGLCGRKEKAREKVKKKGVKGQCIEIILKSQCSTLSLVCVCENSLMLMSLFYVIILDMSNIAK